MKIKFFKKQHSFKKENFILNTRVCWEVAIFGSLVVIVSSLLFSYHLFVSINRESGLPVQKANGKVPTVDQSRIEKDLLYFSKRESKSAEILNSEPSVVDPSQ